MKRLILPALLLLTANLSACSSLSSLLQHEAPPVAATPVEKVDMQTAEFMAGRSSVTVEKLAQKNHCTGGKGAGLLTTRGPVEIYRMSCNEGGVFLARCELRQCQPMASRQQ